MERSESIVARARSNRRKILDFSQERARIDVDFSKNPTLSAALCCLLTLYLDCSQSQSQTISDHSKTLGNDENLLIEISRMFQQTHGDWCKIVIGEMASRFSSDNQGQALVLAKNGAWIPLWDSIMAYDKVTKTIFYESKESTDKNSTKQP